MDRIVGRTEIRDLWVVATIGDSSDEYGTRALLFERFCETETAATDFAKMSSCAIVFPVQRVRRVGDRVNSSD
jgi:hypothetical protein